MKIYVDVKLLGSYYVFVVGLFGFYFCVVFCENIVVKCVKGEVDEFNVFVYLIFMIDINCR